MKRTVYIFLLIITSILTLTLLVFGGLVRTYTDIYLPLGALLVFPVFTAGVYLCEAVLLFVGISRILREFKHRYVFGGVLVLTLIVVLLVVPITKAFGTASYKMNYDLRNEFVKTFAESAGDYVQVDVDTYYVEDVRLSYTGTVTVDVKDETTKIMFYVSEGPVGSAVLVYSTDGSGVVQGDFSRGIPPGYSFEFKNVIKLDNNWSFAVVK